MSGMPSELRIHPTAIIDPTAALHETVEVGPYSVVGPHVEIGADCRIESHVVVSGPLRMGKRNHVFPFAALGGLSQDMSARAEDDTRVEIGDDNTIREYVTVQRGTRKDTGITRLGNRNWVMAYVHVAHDCVIGDHTVLANGTTLAGHVVIEDWAVLGGATLVHQFCRLGAHCFSAGGSGITRDVPPFIVVQGNPASPRGVNVEGIRRRDFSADDLTEIKKAYRTLFMSGQTREQALNSLRALTDKSPHIRRMVEFVLTSDRLIQK